ncbi:MAG: amino acid adenylation domain-containing protein, partial [Saprospiraceae bacterium]
MNRFPLHLSQQEIYFDQVIKPNSPYYNVGGYVVLKGKLDKSVFAHTINSLPEVFDALQLQFNFDEIAPQCEFSSAIPAPQYAEMDFSASSDPQGTAIDWMQGRFNQAFDLKGNQFYENYLLQIGVDEYWWFMRYHHLITDGFGFSVLMHYVADQYSQSVNSKIAPKTFNFPTYQAEIQKSLSYLDSASYAKDEKYWLDLFAQVPAPILLKKVNPDNLVEQGGILTLEIGAKQRKRFEEIGQLVGTGLQQLTLAALTLLYGRTENRETLVFGVPLHKRRNKIQRNTVGMFTGVIPFKGVYQEDQTLENLIKAVKSQQRTDYRYQNYPISHLNRALKLLQEDRAQLFEIEVIYDQLDFVLNLDGLESKSQFLSSDAKISPLEFRWCDYGAAQPLELKLSYATDYLSKEEADLLMHRLLHILDQFATALDQKVSNIDILPKVEEQLLLQDFNQTEATYPQDQSLIDLFEQQVERTPEQIALSFADEKLSYRELNEKANQLAHFLAKKGVKAKDMVAVLLERSTNMLVSLLAIQKLGAAYIPIDPAYPEERIAYILEDTAVPLIVTSKEQQALLPLQTEMEIVFVAASQKTIRKESNKNLKLVSAPEATVYLIYTSGSTGKPKGVMISNRALMNFLSTMLDKLILQPQVKFERLLALTTYSFDIAYLELYLPLITGAEVILTTRSVSMDAELLKALIAKTRPSLMQATPSTWQLLVDGGWTNEEAVLILSGGEPIKERLKNILTGLSAQTVWNMYGPTETTIWSTMGILQRNTKVNIGKPIANTQVYILKTTADTQTVGRENLLPIGGIGELCIAGDGLATGYLNRPELTQEKFIANPFSDTPNAKLYRTGDLAKWLPNGDLACLGRMDDQVKIRGHRIELGEIETVLQQYEFVKACVVVAKENVVGRNTLVAYLTVTQTFDEAAQLQLRAFLAEKLPNYMIPNLMHALESLPLTPNGKIDKNALPDLDGTMLLSTVYLAPRTALETELTAIWKTVLELEQVGVMDNFFELGGHSLLASRVVAAIRNELELNVAIKDLFTHKSVAALASYLAAQEATTVPKITTTTRPEQIPLSFSQERLWFIDQLEGSTHYHMPFVQRMSGDLSIDALTEAFKILVNRHEVLRTVMREEEGIVYQQVLAKNQWSLSYEDQLTDTSEEALTSLVQEALAKPFNLAKDHLLRVKIVKLSAKENLLILVLHHIASDGWSNSIFIEELAALYEAQKNNKAANLPALPIQYADYAIWQRNHLQGDLLENKLNYWVEKMQGAAVLDLPTDFLRPVVQSLKGSQFDFKVSKPMASALEALAQQEGVTMFMLLLSAFKTLLFKYTRQEDITIGTPIANRSQAELESLIGFFVNTIPLRSNLGDNPRFHDLLTQVKTTTLDAYLHQDVPFEKIVESVVEERDLSRSPLFQVLFSYENNLEITTVDLASKLNLKRSETT